MAQTKYPIHSQYERHITAEQAILNNLKNKSTPLIVNDSFIPPINSERTDLPWTLGSKSHPWKNLYISNTPAGNATAFRGEVLDVYAELKNAVTQDKLDELEIRLANSYATKAYVQTEARKPATETMVGGFKSSLATYVKEYKPATAETTDTILIPTIQSGFLIKIDDTETTIPYWRKEYTLYDKTSPKDIYLGTDFYWAKIGTAFPGVYKEEFDNYYTVLYKDVKDTVTYVGEIFQRYPAGYIYTVGESAKTDYYWGDLSGSIYNQTDLIDFVNSSVQTATAYFCGNWETWNDIPVLESGFSALGYNVPGLNNYLVVNNDTSHGHDGSRWRYKYDQKVTTKVPYDKNHWIPEYPVNDKPFTAAEKAALGSGITSAKVATYDAYATNKVGFTDLASTSAVGVVKVDNSTIKVDSTGTISVANPLGIQAVLSEDE